MLSYAGVSLLHHDPEGELTRFLGRHFDIRDLRQFGLESVGVRSLIRGPRHVTLPQGYGVPVVNYPAPPQLRINSLYWPTGAARWAQGLFLVDYERLTEIQEAIGDSYGPAQLVIGDEDFDGSVSDDDFSTDDKSRTVVSTAMWLLPPRPISATGQFGGEQSLWLLPLVDDRYWWQFRSGAFSAPVTSWSFLFSELASALGITILGSTFGETGDGDWGAPDGGEINRPHQSPPVLLDAAAWSTGRRIVRDIRGDVTLMNLQAGSINTLSENLNGLYQQVAGGENTWPVQAASAVESVKVVFRDPDNLNTLHVITKTASEIGGYEFTPGTSKTFFTPSWDPFEASTPTPLSSALAVVIAEAHYRSTQRHYDLKYAGIKRWLHTGFDDAVTWAFGRQHGDGSYEAETRAWSMPLNVGVDVLLNQVGTYTAKPDSPLRWGKTDDAIAKWADGTVTLWTGKPGVTVGDDAEAESDPPESVPVQAVGVALLDYHRVELHPVEGLPEETPELAWPMECAEDVEERPE